MIMHDMDDKHVDYDKKFPLIVHRSTGHNKISHLVKNLDLNNGKNFTTMEWLMVFVEVPL